MQSMLAIKYDTDIIPGNRNIFFEKQSSYTGGE